MNVSSIFACIFKPLGLYKINTAQDFCSYSIFLFCSSSKTTTQDASCWLLLDSHSKQRPPNSRTHPKALDVVYSPASARTEGFAAGLAHPIDGVGLPFLGYIEWSIALQLHTAPEQFTQKLMSKLCHSASRHKNCKRTQTLDSKKNAAKKGLLKQTQIWSGEGRPRTYLFQKGFMRGSSLMSYTNSCLKVILDRPAPRGELETSYIHQHSWQLFQHCCWSYWWEALGLLDHA